MRIYGVQVGDTVTVEAISEEGTIESLTLTVDGLEGPPGNEFFPLTTDDFEDEYGSVPGGWKIYQVTDPVMETNSNVEQNEQGQYTCSGAGGGNNGPPSSISELLDWLDGLRFVTGGLVVGFGMVGLLAVRRRNH